MRLLELVKTLVTTDEVLNTAKAFGQSIGKETVVAKDAPGFIVNRLLTPFMLEAMRLLEMGFATKEDIDKAVKLGLNFPMGPFELGDLVGLDTAYFIANSMYNELYDTKFAAPVLLKKMVAARHFGRKTGRGFYEYK